MLHPSWANRADLYFLLMYLRRDSHRFFICPELNSTLALIISLAARSDTLKGSNNMLDVILLALGFAFFALSIGYAYACDRL